MKRFTSILIFSILILASIAAKYNFAEEVLFIAKINYIDSSYLKDKIEKDLKNISGVVNCEISLKSNTLLMKYDQRKVNMKGINSVIEKWDCSLEEISYQKLF